MADKPITTDVGANAQYSSSTLNANFSIIENAIEGCLGRGGTSESPNSMQGSLDMDLNKIINLGAPSTDNDAVRLIDLSDSDATGSASAQLRSEVVPKDSVAALKSASLDPGTYINTKGYFTPGDGGGAIYLIKTVADFGGSPDGYGDHLDAAGNVAVLQGNGPFSPLQFGVPLTSSGTDYQPNLQALLDKRYFVFPEGFESHTTTLYPRSHSLGFFGNAKFTLMPNQDSGVQIVVLGDASGYLCEDSTFYGGVFDGDRDNQTANGNVGIAGGDGGLHCLQIHNAKRVHWYESPQFINAGTDGIIVWKRTSHPTYGTTFVDDVHIYNPKCDGNSRQGISVIASTDMNFHDAECINTIGKLPEAGIDIEGNNSADTIACQFYGITICESNNGRGFTTHSPGASYNLYIEHLKAINNGATDGQVYFYNASGDASQNIYIEKIGIAGSASDYSLVVDNFAYTTETPFISFTFNELYTDDRVHLNARSKIIGQHVTAYTSVASVDLGALTVEDDVSGYIAFAELWNTSGTSNGFPLILKGDSDFTIGLAKTNGARGVYLKTATNKTVKIEIDGTLLANGINLLTSSNNLVDAEFKSVHSNPGIDIPDGCNDNIIKAVDHNSSTYNFAVINGDRNILIFKATRTGSNILVYFDTLSADNYLHSSWLKGDTLGAVTNLGTNNSVTDNFFL